MYPGLLGKHHVPWGAHRRKFELHLPSLRGRQVDNLAFQGKHVQSMAAWLGMHQCAGHTGSQLACVVLPGLSECIAFSRHQGQLEKLGRQGKPWYCRATADVPY